MESEGARDKRKLEGRGGGSLKGGEAFNFFMKRLKLLCTERLLKVYFYTGIINYF